MEMMKLKDYSADKRACKVLGVHFEHVIRPCPLMFYLPNGELASLGLTYSIHAQIDRRLPELAPYTIYKLQDVCGDVYWNKLNKTQRQLAHVSVNYLIEHEGLPMIYITSAVGKRYKLSK